MELGRNGQHHRRHGYYVQGLQRCPGVQVAATFHSGDFESVENFLIVNTDY